MSNAERPVAPAADLPARLSRALVSAEPEPAVRDALSRASLPEAACEALLEQALQVGRRGRSREPRASGLELQLALGVLLALHGSAARAEAERKL